MNLRAAFTVTRVQIPYESKHVFFESSRLTRLPHGLGGFHAVAQTETLELTFVSCIESNVTQNNPGDKVCGEYNQACW